MQKERKYDRPIPIAAGVYWVGFYEEETKLHCNPYLLIEGAEAVLIDGGSRPDFAVVMTKILQTGLDPHRISHLIYQHYDPDLCGSIPHFIEMCDHPGLQVLSHPANNVFIRYYVGREQHHYIASIKELPDGLALGGRRLRFLDIPYCHTGGSFVTYDESTKTLFTSDLFGSFARQWDLHLALEPKCYVCADYSRCPSGKSYCPLPDILDFHRIVMPCNKALHLAMHHLSGLDIELIAPQHGSIISKKEDIAFLIKTLAGLDGVGIDGIA